MPDDRLALLRELEQADEAVAAELAELDELYAAVEELRRRGLELAAFLARLPEERAAAAQAVDESGRALAEARTALDEAAATLAQAEAGTDPERAAQARRRELVARDTVHVAERRAAAARQQADELESRAQAADTEARALEERAGESARALARRPRLADEAVGHPAPGTAVAEWGTRARAALLVARSQLAAERDAVVRQANELGTVVLGEALPALATHEVVRRVEGALER